jgi:hypothetical protein
MPAFAGFPSSPAKSSITAMSYSDLRNAVLGRSTPEFTAAKENVYHRKESDFSSFNEVHQLSLWGQETH